MKDNLKKYSIASFAIIALALIGFTQKNTAIPEECDYSGCVGDVKYSILGETEFQKLNGKGWVIMAGQTIDDATSVYYSPYLSSLSKLPDARGNFIRSMNVNGGSDPFDSENGFPRQVGKVQNFAVQNHTHSLSQLRSVVKDVDPGIKSQSAGGWMRGLLGDTNTDGPSGSISVETRPVNISLYCYIKIK
jgi:hypothetical protein